MSPRAVLLPLLFLSAGCLRATLPQQEPLDLLVIAPHPDDEVLLAGGVMQRAVREGRKVEVIIVTNGDFTCERDGYQREAESIAALRLLGVPERAVHFLGYPDGALAQLGQEPLTPREHRDATGRCVARTGTYADRSAGRLDEHTARTGEPAEWTADNLTADLEALLRRLRPREVYLPHGIDEHPDHAQTYVYFRRALDRLSEAPMVVHRGLVHVGPCWPSDCRAGAAPREPTPPLPGPLAAYLPGERVPIDGAAKLEAISLYVSQASPWLDSFARADETFYPERYERRDGRWVRAGGQARGVGARLNHEGVMEEWTRWGPDGFAGVEVRLTSPSASSR